jgi:hypothetical protein
MQQLSLQGVLDTFPVLFRSRDLECVVSLLIQGSVSDCPHCFSHLQEYGCLLNYCQFCHSIRTKSWIDRIHSLAQHYMDGHPISIVRGLF